MPARVGRRRGHLRIGYFCEKFYEYPKQKLWQNSQQVEATAEPRRQSKAGLDWPVGRAQLKCELSTPCGHPVRHTDRSLAREIIKGFVSDVLAFSLNCHVLRGCLETHQQGLETRILQRIWLVSRLSTALKLLPRLRRRRGQRGRGGFFPEWLRGAWFDG